jgi:aspartyl-tRNA(Asn)/glutamyl-tRNA(Gln) amidotransferase subunit A
MTDNLSFASIRDLGRLLRAGETTPTALAEHFLARLDTVGRRLNAVVTLTRERALDEAHTAERELAAGHDRGPLHGIPYGAKDLCATAIARLRVAGAVLVAKLAMVELAGGMGYNQPDAAFTGPGLNPWDPGAWSGGSSSGSGSAVGAGAVPFAIGSETGGSILTPAAFCGVSGLRPTYGRISRHGAMALCWTFDKLGPMCRTADDCGLALHALAGHDPRDDTSLAEPYTYDPARDRADGFRLAVPRDVLASAQSEVAANFRATLDTLRAVATVEEIDLPDFPYGPVFGAILQGESASSFDDFIASGQVAALTDPEDRIGGYARRFLPAKDYLNACRIRRDIIAAWDDLLARHDAILAPTIVVVASPIDTRFSDYFPRDGRPSLTTIGNIIGAPAISVPNGFGERNLPTGVQIMSRAGADNTTLAVARAYQSLTTHHLHHPTH